MWTQVYAPLAGNLVISALAASLPIFVLLVVLGILRLPAWISSLIGLAVSLLVALFVYGMPARLGFNSILYGAAYGLLPIGWIVFTAILLYRLTVATGKFEIIKNSIGGLTGNHFIQALLIAFAFGAFVEGAAGFGTPVAVAAAMLAGLGFKPFEAAAICLLANTSPVAFGSIGTPTVMLQAITKLPLRDLSANIGRLCAPISIFVPAYLILVMGGGNALRSVLPAAIVCGLAFGGVQFFVSNYIGPYLTDILSALTAMAALVLLLKFWKPVGGEKPKKHNYRLGEIVLAWTPYILLVILVLIWGYPSTKMLLDRSTVIFGWPGLHNQVLRVAPITADPSPYAASYTLNLLSASGTACLFAVLLSAVVLRVSPRNLVKWTGETARQLALPTVTIMSVLALAFLMNYSGQTATLGLIFAGTGKAFPFFSTLLGWLGVFLTGSDTSANALFGTLQVVTASRLGFNSVLMAAANSSGGVMGKMISLQSIAVAAAATQMPRMEEARLFRFTLRHSIFLTIITGLLVMFYAYVMPGWVR